MHVRARGQAAAITHLLYYGGIRLSGHPPGLSRGPHLPGALLRRGRPFHRIPRVHLLVTAAQLPGRPRSVINMPGGRVVSVPLPRVSPAPLAGSGLRGEGGVSSAFQGSAVAASRGLPPLLFSYINGRLIFLGPATISSARMSAVTYRAKLALPFMGHNMVASVLRWKFSV